MKIISRDELISLLAHGNAVKYLFFWGHQKPKTGVSKTCFSQWYESSFKANGETYQTAEHYMMVAKARLFDNEDIAQKILNANNPGSAKKLGRQVKNFDNKIWCQQRFEIVVEANVLKFTQNPELSDFLLGTGDRVLVEASPVDAIWGIGLVANSPAAQNPERWEGLNLLGFALTEVRERLV